MRETHLRSLMKAFSWRLSGSLVTMFIVYIITGKINFALYIGFFEFIFKIVFFYLHERIWGLIHFGTQDYKSKNLN
ncbi:DUF2061 domain-containing protein [Legionella fallonii]|uniref:DUF2061 domain-containing protein n=1 Tax=Legionella fallonii LLAP-10 TaxID=1212491 RepID=A0A098G5P0_9GAMM|nr:DUF2061 domain-containing protein [Legionella fallonii]CEG57772.1 conserved protein of unknown function [Legionella fallonii LLAP-10]